MLSSGAQAQRWFRPSHDEQVKAGLQAAQQIRKESKVLPETDIRSQVVKEIFNDILAQMPDKDRKNWKFSFDVIESTDVNAFALPGGPMFIYTGLLDKVSTKDALAGIIGHELTHVLGEHYARQVERERNRQAGLVLLGTIFRASNSVMQVGDLVTQVSSGIPYGQKSENDADEGGFKLMVGAKYNPGALMDVFELFKKLEGKNGPPAFLRSHPVNDKRIAHIKELMTKSKMTFPASRPLPEMPKTPEPVKKDPNKKGN